MLRLLTTPGFPPTRTGLRAAVRPCARPRCGPSGLFATAPRFFESTQRACPGGEPPGYPPAQFGYVLLFPASETGRFAGSISGLWPCAGMLSAVLCTQSGAYQGKKVGAWRPFHEFAFRIMPDQAPNWVCKTAPTLSAAGRSPLEGHLHRRGQDAGKLLLALRLNGGDTQGGYAPLREILWLLSHRGESNPSGASRGVGGGIPKNLKPLRPAPSPPGPPSPAWPGPWRWPA